MNSDDEVTRGFAFEHECLIRARGLLYASRSLLESQGKIVHRLALDDWMPLTQLTVELELRDGRQRTLSFDVWHEGYRANAEAPPDAELVADIVLGDVLSPM